VKYGEMNGMTKKTNESKMAKENISKAEEI